MRSGLAPPRFVPRWSFVRIAPPAEHPTSERVALTFSGTSMARLNTSEVAELLAEFGRRTALLGGNPYRARAYTRAAENLLTVGESISQLVQKNRLTEIKN